jgi:hypothetical protein
MIGLWTFFFPGSFFEDFPIKGANWVSTLGEYNEHLTRDYGAAQLGLGVVATGVAMGGGRTGTVSVLAGYVVFGSLHFGYHLGNFSPFSTGSAVAQGFSLMTFIAVPAVVLAVLRYQSKEGNTR